MAFPQIRTGGYRYGAEIADVTAHSVTLPSEAEIGDLILVFFAVDSNVTLTIDTGISGANWNTASTRNLSAVTAGVFWKIAQGEGYDYLTINTTSEMASFVSYAIYNHFITTPITISSSATGTSANMNPPSLTPSYGGHDYLWFVFGGMDGIYAAEAAPTDFSGLLVANNASSQGSTCSVAYREYNTSSAYNPDAFTSTAEDWITYTVIVNPASVNGIPIPMFGYIN